MHARVDAAIGRCTLKIVKPGCWGLMCAFRRQRYIVSACEQRHRPRTSAGDDIRSARAGQDGAGSPSDSGESMCEE
jgi:hypothetical protein